MLFVRLQTGGTEKRYLVVLDHYVRYLNTGTLLTATVGRGGLPVSSYKPIAGTVSARVVSSDVGKYQPALVLREAPNKLDEIEGKAAIEVIMVNIYESHHDGWKYGQYLAAGILKTEKEGKDEFRERGYTCQYRTEGSEVKVFQYRADDEAADGEFLQEQRWCVG